MKHILSIDFEDWYQVPLAGVPLEKWDSAPCAIHESAEHLLRFLDGRSIKATFFVSGYIADRHPDLIRAIDSAGHEIQSHGYWHKLAYHQTDDEFREDLDQSIRSIESIIGRRPTGYRAPAWSISFDRARYLPILKKAGFSYDSSLFPTTSWQDIFRDHQDVYDLEAYGLLEVAPTALRLLGVSLPLTGGFFMRVIPQRLFLKLLRTQHKNGRRIHLYFHPWEVLNNYPMMPINPLFKFVQYYNCGNVLDRLARICDEFEMSSIRDAYADRFHLNSGR